MNLLEETNVVTEKITAIPSGIILSVGVETLTHSREGLKLYPHKVVMIRIEDAWFDLTPNFARVIASRLDELAEEAEVANGTTT